MDTQKIFLFIAIFLTIFLLWDKWELTKTTDENGNIITQTSIVTSDSQDNSIDVPEVSDVPSAAASIIEANPVAASEASYYTQSNLAKAMGKAHARASTILLRGAVEQTLAQAKSKYYPHAVRYIKQLIELQNSIKDWGPLETHTDWFAKMIDRHARKSSFIKKLESANIL